VGEPADESGVVVPQPPGHTGQPPPRDGGPGGEQLVETGRRQRDHVRAAECAALAGDTDSERIFAYLSAAIRGTDDVTAGLVARRHSDLPVYALNLLPAGPGWLEPLRFPNQLRTHRPVSAPQRAALRRLPRPAPALRRGRPRLVAGGDRRHAHVIYAPSAAAGVTVFTAAAYAYRVRAHKRGG